MCLVEFLRSPHVAVFLFHYNKTNNPWICAFAFSHQSVSVIFFIFLSWRGRRLCWSSIQSFSSRAAQQHTHKDKILFYISELQSIPFRFKHRQRLVLRPRKLRQSSSSLCLSICYDKASVKYFSQIDQIEAVHFHLFIVGLFSVIFSVLIRASPALNDGS